MEWIKYQMQTLNQWVEYSPKAAGAVPVVAAAILFGFIALNECGLL